MGAREFPASTECKEVERRSESREKGGRVLPPSLKLRRDRRSPGGGWSDPPLWQESGASARALVFEQPPVRHGVVLRLSLDGFQRVLGLKYWMRACR